MKVFPKGRGTALCVAGTLFLLVFPLFVKDLDRGELNLNNDETRHAMTGIYFRDLMVDFPVDDLLGYTYRYYACYPALGLIHWPPLFHFTEGLFFLVFGISVPGAKLLVALFALLLIFYWFRLVKALFSAPVAFFACLLLASAPMVVLYSRTVMLEIPSLALSVGAIFYFHRYFEEEKGGPLCMTFFFIAGCLTRSSVAFLVPVFILYILLRKKQARLFSRSMICPGFLVLITLCPYYTFTLIHHGSMLFKDITMGTAALADEGWGVLDRLYYYISILPSQIGWPMLCTALFTTFYLVVSRSAGKYGLWFLWILTCYLLFTAIGQMDPRYIIYWIPPFTLLAALPAGISRGSRARVGGLVLVAAVCAFNFYNAFMFVRPHVEGYEEAARFVVKNSGSKTVFFQGFLNGNFIFHVRQADPERKLIIIRGGKVLVATNILKEYNLLELAHCEADIHEVLQRYGVEYVVVEDRDIVNLPIFKVLRDMLKGPDFEEKARFPLKTNVPLFEGMHVVAYHYLKAKPLKKGTRLVLPMLTLDRDLEIDLEEL